MFYPNLNEPDVKKYLPQKLKDTKDIFIILSSCIGVLVAMKKGILKHGGEKIEFDGVLKVEELLKYFSS